MITDTIADATSVPIAPGRTRRTVRTDNLMLVVWEFTDGPAAEPDPYHDHPHEQLTFVAEGEVLFYVNDKYRRLGPGDMVVVPSSHPHRIQTLTSRVRLVDAFTPIRKEFL